VVLVARVFHSMPPPKKFCPVSLCPDAAADSDEDDDGMPQVETILQDTDDEFDIVDDLW